jgi:hypothetical protein
MLRTRFRAALARVKASVRAASVNGTGVALTAPDWARVITLVCAALIDSGAKPATRAKAETASRYVFMTPSCPLQMAKKRADHVKDVEMMFIFKSFSAHSQSAS